MSYAEKTTVSSEKSIAEIQKTLKNYGAKRFAYGYDESKAIVQFQTDQRRVRFVLPLPDRNDRQFTHTPGRNLPRDRKGYEAAYEQAIRQRWRALALVIKAKLEAVETGIVSFDTEFLAHIVLPGDQTVGEMVVPGVELAYETGHIPELLAEYSGPKAIES